MERGDWDAQLCVTFHLGPGAWPPCAWEVAGDPQVLKSLGPPLTAKMPDQQHQWNPKGKDPDVLPGRPVLALCPGGTPEPTPALTAEGSVLPLGVMGPC
jgi:hypothetical protein